MDDAWAASMQHWGAQLELLQQGLHQSSVELRLATTDHHRTCAASLARLADARLRAELVGLAGLPRPQTRALHATTATLQSFATFALASIVAAAPVVPWLGEKLKDRPVLRDTLGLAGLAFVFVACTMKLAAQTHNPFIYFRF